MTTMTIGRRDILQGLAAAAVLAVSFGAAAAQAEPVTIRIGYSTAAEEPLWLLMAKPDIGSNYGKAYTLDATRFTSSEKRAQAFAADAVDIGSGSAGGALFAAAEGIPMKMIASLSKESRKGEFSTSFLALADSPIKSIKDLKGKTVSVNGFSTAGELWLRAALEKNGMSETDVTVVPVSFAAMGESLKSGRIDVGEFPQPFAAMAERDMKVRTIFTAKDGVPFDEELLVLTAQPAFLKAHPDAVRAFLADLKAAMKFYIDHSKEARQILIDKKFVRLTPDIYLTMKDYYRDPTLRVEPEAIKQMQALQTSAGFQKKQANVADIVDNSYLPK
jgi:ABC-type nitrate/sulfonate/bicarbonate transport system substrate-binding protein